MVKTSPSDADGRGCGLDPGWGAKPHLPRGQKNQSIKWEQCCNNFNKGFKKKEKNQGLPSKYKGDVLGMLDFPSHHPLPDY